MRYRAFVEPEVRFEGIQLRVPEIKLLDQSLYEDPRLYIEQGGGAYTADISARSDDCPLPCALLREKCVPYLDEIQVWRPETHPSRKDFFLAFPQENGVGPIVEALEEAYTGRIFVACFPRLVGKRRNGRGSPPKGKILVMEGSAVDAYRIQYAVREDFTLTSGGNAIAIENDQYVASF
ncbi:MAG: hypothetical protein KKA90_03825 [Nanoarchaeota archaeon]|nr:hypothetical protein [Nanoarchaeota archaeon]